MNFLEALAVILIPLIPVVLPGAFFIRIHDFTNLLISGTRIIVWSMGILTIMTTIGLAAGIPATIIALILTIISIANLSRKYKQFFSQPALWHVMAMVIPMTVGLVIFAIPFFTIHDALPTGDVQKTILWASKALATNTTPVYQDSIALLNRDPVDFYTPGLHAISSLIMGLSPAPLTSMGLFAIVIALCVAWIAGTLTKEMFDNHPHVVPPVLAGIFTLTQYRFLRYLREPGYHFQNVVGELFVFAMLLLFIRFMRRREMQDAILFLVAGAALFLTHQFSMFIAVFVIASAMVAAVFEYRTRILHAMKFHAKLSLSAMALLLIVLAIASSLQLGNKVPALFTRTPHLTEFIVPLAEYSSRMGSPVWFFAGLTGCILMVLDARRKDAHHRQVISFASATAMILLLSQGPRFGIDIPPVRALFYIVVPCSVGAAYLFGKLFLVFKHTYSRKGERIAWAALTLVIIITCSASTYAAYASLSHTVRTNSTLTGEQLGLIETLATSKEGGILIDDYNRRSASWLVLSGKPMVTRIAADLRQQMRESSQSKLRRDLYVNQLDYEKIFSIGSRPEVGELLDRRGIRYVAAVEGSSDTALSHNPIFQPIGRADDLVLYQVQQHALSCKENPNCALLLRPTTLANDIGDTQDTFLHLMASIRTARLSDPITTATRTYRQTDARYIPLEFNVGDYVQAVWDPNTLGRPETPLTFLMNLTQPVPSASLITPSGEKLPLGASTQVKLALSPQMTVFDERGFVSLIIDNPKQERIGIDMIALGPSLTP